MTERIKIVHLKQPTDEEILAIETCPGFDNAKEEAFNDSWEAKWCGDCMGQVQVKFYPYPYTPELRVKGICPKQ